MGETLWAAVTTEEVIPAQSITWTSTPAVLQHLRSALNVGGEGSPGLSIRNA